MGDSDAGTARKKRRYRTRKIVPRTPDAIDPGDHRKYDGSQGIGGKIDGRGDRTQSATEGSEAAALAAAAVRDESGDAARTAETETTQANQENILGVEEQPKRAYRSKYRQRLAEQEAAVTAKTILDILNRTASLARGCPHQSGHSRPHSDFQRSNHVPCRIFVVGVSHSTNGAKQTI